jgi:hypothetical protein
MQGFGPFFTTRTGDWLPFWARETKPNSAGALKYAEQPASQSRTGAQAKSLNETERDEALSNANQPREGALASDGSLCYKYWAA